MLALRKGFMGWGKVKEILSLEQYDGSYISGGAEPFSDVKM
jgi:hypothetical protein